LKLSSLGPGCFYLEVPEVGLRILCGCPPDSVKSLKKLGFIYNQTVQGVVCETGPNAILLGDLAVQADEISNLTEFPVLHMLYKQGLGIPGHPNRASGKPMLIGRSPELSGQAEYIRRGNYGLYSEEEYQALGLDEKTYKLYLEIKLQFAFGRFLETRELMDLVAFDQETLELKGGLWLQRLEPNHFEARLGEERLEFDLNLTPLQRYQPTYSLPWRPLPQGRFAVVHLGDGDGWDDKRPCLGSLLLVGEKRYLVDAGPFVSENLKHLGIGPQEVEGLFLTHVHDDHFGGFYGLFCQNPRLKVLATTRIFLTLLKKYAALTGKPEAYWRERIAFVPLVPGEWNRVGALEARPLPSAHPIDTTLFLFRVNGEGGYKTYGHLTDIANLKVLSQFAGNLKAPEAFERFEQELIEVYRAPLDIKKVDVGGGFVHGDAMDFATDPSPVLLLSHTTDPIPPGTYPKGVQTGFGDFHVLVP